MSTWTPVLHEGRYQPYGALPEEQQNISILQKEGRLPFKNHPDEYLDLIGTPYQKAHGKALYYPSKGQLKAELFLHKFPVKWILITGYLLAIIYKKILPLPFALHTLILALNCYILSRPPVSNMAETIFYVPWVAVLVSFIFKKQRIGALIGATLLFFLPKQLTFENAQAVLDSQYWLIIHVLMVVGSYGFFFFAGVLGHLYLIKPNQTLEHKILRSLYLGTCLLIGGTLLGGVWAAQSWGRFWDWDPKEAWAFISSGMYLIVVHAYKFKKIQAQGLAIGAILGLLTITFTWYGVNYILAAGLHSYGFGAGGALFYYLYLLSEGIFLTFFIFKHIYTNCQK